MPLGLSFTSKGFGRNKKHAPEEKSEVDIATVLPASNEFRTSLLMPNLSARFSMLREQDDPATKIGKANDDSVLFPKRASKLNLFAHNDLADITEVGCASESVRPPLAPRDRAHSYDVDGYDSDRGSGIMSRPRPGEGNNLFGGRQKLYKLPTQASIKPPMDSQTPDRTSWTRSGKPLYEDDISLSLFQKHRQQQQNSHKEQRGEDVADEAENSSIGSPAPSFRRFRETTSSTASGLRRLSTAATSIDSQPFSPQRQQPHNQSSPTTTASKTAVGPGPGQASNNRKLYEQALAPSYPHQLGAKDALESFARPGAISPQKNQSPDAEPKAAFAALQMTLQPGALHPPSQFCTINRPILQPSLSTPNLNSELSGGHSPNGDKHVTTAGTCSSSPPVSETVGVAAFDRSISPEDRGKVTAMGLFNRPHQDYDEEQFSQRQLQLREDRERAAPGALGISAESSRCGTSSDDHRPEVSSEVNGRDEADVDGKTRLQSQSSHGRSSNPNSDGTVGPTEPPKSSLDLASCDPTKTEDKKDANEILQPATGRKTTPHETHPAFRNTIEEFQFPSQENLGSKQSDGEVHPSESSQAVPAGLGLSGLVRTHLRADSDKSSIFPRASPHASFASLPESQPLTKARDAATTTPEVGTADTQLTHSARHMLAAAKTIQETAVQKRIEADNSSPSHLNREDSSGWQDELQLRHQRGGSTETQQERAAFNEELAERRRKVQESLKNVAEVSSRSASPTPSTDSSMNKASNGISALLRGKSSRPKFSNPPSVPSMPLMPPGHSDQPGKAMKVLGLGGVSGASSPPAKSAPSQIPQEELWKEEEEKMLEAFSKRARPRAGITSPPSIPKGFLRPRPSQPSMKNEHNGDQSRPGIATSKSVPNPLRDRSSSELSTRQSKSLHHDIVNDSQQAPVEKVNSGRWAQGALDTSDLSTVEQVPNRAEKSSQQAAAASSSASAGSDGFISRAPTAKNSEGGSLTPLQTETLSGPSSSKSSPGAGYSNSRKTPTHGAWSVGDASFPSSPAAGRALQTGETRTMPSLRGRKRSVTKNMISEPTFVSTTYSVSTVDLPQSRLLRSTGSHDGNARDLAPPAIPTINPRRRGRVDAAASTTQTIPSEGRVQQAEAPHSAGPTMRRGSPEQGRGNASPFPSPEKDDQGLRPAPLKAKSKPRLRKISSEGGDLNSKARYQALMAAPSPVLPTFPVVKGGPVTTAPPPLEGGMF